MSNKKFSNTISRDLKTFQNMPKLMDLSGLAISASNVKYTSHNAFICDDITYFTKLGCKIPLPSLPCRPLKKLNGTEVTDTL